MDAAESGHAEETGRVLSASEGQARSVLSVGIGLEGKAPSAAGLPW
jgi:hypothetical protein